MRHENESHFSFLIAFARQLAAAIEVGDRIESVAIAVASLATSLGVLLADGSDEAGEDAGGADDGEEGDDYLDGDDDEMERADSPELEALKLELERLRALSLARPGVAKRVVGVGQRTADDGATPAGQPAVLTNGKSSKKGAKRRGKK